MASPAVTSKLGAELEWLRRTQRRFRAAISDAEQGRIEGEDWARWLQEMKDIACDAEDLIDEFEYEELRRQIRGRGGSASSLSEEVMLRKITAVRQRVEVILIRENNGPRNEDLVGSWDDAEVTQGERMLPVSLTEKGEVIGREKEKEEIIEFLVAPDDEVTPSTIAIAGMGGLGKTTLAQLVYNDSRVETHFTVKMWVCLTADEDVVEVTRLILGATGFDMTFMCGVKNLDLYQRKLVDKLKGQQFFLVMDNLSDPDYRKWQTIYAPLIYGEKGSKVLITTRDRQVARNLLATKTFELGGLQFYDCLRLFMMHAFPHGNCEEQPRLEVIGKQIVEKFEGVPLAAVVMGGHLGSRLEEDEWMRILERDIWEKCNEDGILSVLKLSYDNLPPQLKQCFAYCSLFPKNYKFDRIELVHLWMAQGFVQTRRMKRMEDVGTEYFNDLLHRSFFQFADGKFAIHDLMHDLAQLVSHYDHSIADINHGLQEMLLNRDAHKVRHLSLLVDRRQPNQTSLEALYRYRNLRTLAFYYSRKVKFHIPYKLLRSFNRLRFLDLSDGGLKFLPDSIGTLVHLRYLDLRENQFRWLPESLCHLYFLQILKLKGCHDLRKLPRGISNLINLRHLEAEDRALSHVVGLGKLTCLQQLESLTISRGKGIKIEDLKNMNDLRGMISIDNLRSVRSKEGAMQAMLSRKRYLRKLVMRWDGWDYVEGGNFELEEEIFEALEPPLDLKELSIKFYGGLKFPSWMEHPSFTKLESLCLRGCRNLNSLPRIWRLPFLETIELVGCPQLKNLPPISTGLRELTIDDIGLEELPDLYQRPSDHHESFNSTATPSLSVLRVRRCHALKSLQRGLLRCHLRHLTVLSIQDCRELLEWPEGDEFRATLLSLQKELYLNGCPKLGAFPSGTTLSASLEKISIMGCPNIVDGPLIARLQDLPSESIVCVKKKYTNLQHCFQEALRHIGKMNRLVIEEDHEVKEWKQYHSISLVCNRERLWSWRCHKRIVAWSVRILLKSSKMERYMNVLEAGYVLEAGFPQKHVLPEEWWGTLPPPEMSISLKSDDPDSLVSGEEDLPWSSFSRWPESNATWDGASLPFNMQTSVEVQCNSLLTHLMGLKELHVFDCPKLMFSSLWKLIPSLTSLHRLGIRVCSRLLLFYRFCHKRIAGWMELWGGFPLPEMPNFVKSDDPDSPVSSSPGERHLLRSPSFLGSPELPNAIFDGASLPFNIQTSVEVLCISKCRGARPLLADALLTHLTSLKELHVFDCPNLTFSSLQKLIPCLTSLRRLTIKGCPSLSSSYTSSPSPSFLQEPSLLQTLFVDDDVLIGDVGFVRDYLGSLRGLHIWHGGSRLTSLTAKAEEGLRCLGHSLCHLSFKSCPNLEQLPSDLRGLLPSLKALSIGDCPKLRGLPEGCLPAYLEILVVQDCCLLEGRCTPPLPSAGEKGQQQQTDWHKIAHVCVIVNQGDLVQGSYREFLELRGKWRDF